MNKNLKAFPNICGVTIDLHGNVFDIIDVSCLNAVTTTRDDYYGGRRQRAEDYTSFYLSLEEGNVIRILEDDDVSSEDVKAAYDFMYGLMTAVGEDNG